jgi:hypothetical protein
MESGDREREEKGGREKIELKYKLQQNVKITAKCENYNKL